MYMKPALLAGLAGAALSVPAWAGELIPFNGASQTAMQRMPWMLHVPKLPSRLKSPKERSTPPRRSAPAASNASSCELQREYSRDLGMLAYQIDTSWGSKKDNVRIEKAIAKYLEGVDRVARGRFNARSPDTMASENRGLIFHYDMLARTADREIAWIEQGIPSTGVAHASYNQALVLDAALNGAVTLFPENSDYASAKAKTGALMAKLGSRAGAEAAKNEAIMAKARLVKMPAPTERTASVERMFRTPW